MRGLADIARMGFADFDGYSLGLVDMAAEKMLGLILPNEIADGGGTGVDARADPIECGAIRRRVADQDQRREAREALETFRQLCLAIFPRRLERRRIGVAKTRYVPLTHLDMAFVKVVQAITRAGGSDLFGRFVVPRQNVNFVTARLQDLAAT